MALIVNITGDGVLVMMKPVKKFPFQMVFLKSAEIKVLRAAKTSLGERMANRSRSLRRTSMFHPEE